MERNTNVIENRDGKKIVVIHDIRFKGKTRAEWKEIEEILKEYIGKHYEIVETCEVVYIGKEFPDEFTHGTDKTILRGPNLKAKANASLVIGELIQIGTNRSATPDYESRHGKQAAGGWYRYDTRLALPVYNDGGDIVRYNVYRMRMLVREDEKGRLYLYDFLHAKKERETNSPL